MKIERIRTRNIGLFDAWKPERFTHPLGVFDDLGPQPALRQDPSRWTLVEVESDDGTVGLGTAGSMHGGAKGLIDTYYAPLLLGQDPRRHESLWQRMYRATVRFARSGSPITAISALDIALWDLHGKAEGVPIFDLTGGRSRTTAPCYVSRLYAPFDLSELAAEAKRWTAAGFVRMKQRFGHGPWDGPEGMARNVELVRTVREAVGDDVELAADAYMGWDVGYAIEMAKRLRPYNLSWIEEALMPHEIDGYLELKRRCPWQRWSFGEHSYTKWEFKEIIDRRAGDILQPDVNRVGGITETLKICAMAEAAGLPVVPHSNEPHNLQVIFSRPPNVCPVVEYFPEGEPDTGNELFWKVFMGIPEADRGELRVTDAPGLGVDLDHDAVAELQVGETNESSA